MAAVWLRDEVLAGSLIDDEKGSATDRQQYQHQQPIDTRSTCLLYLLRLPDKTLTRLQVEHN